ncbi:hypothetical protein QBC38DRAFT_364198 [Podospora fimiseda]|uniref:Formylmethionine deformylase-like protein n=1 Tax=Podospora fimiseda TaxID=252190 RepID=A0AAN7BPQ8_9PEZI|nr:hypothetical protein QBC38DRAFT_364198 [Podospora fimiseda]
MDPPYQDRQGQQQNQQPYHEEERHDAPAPAPLRPSRVTFFQPTVVDRDDSHSISSVGLGIAHASLSPGYRPVHSRDHSPPAQKSEYQARDYAYSMSSTPDTPEFYHGSQYGTQGAAPEYSQRISTSRPGSRWGWLNAPWVMYALFGAGVVFAAGHHIFYASLDGKPADDQIKMMRFGGLLSYAAKASLVAAVLFGYKQQVWLTVRRKQLRLKTIDSIFSASQDLTALFNWEFIKNAKISIFLVLVSWLFPLTVILTPSSLTVAQITQTKNDTCHSVRTLNFELEKQKNWRLPDRLYHYPGQSLSMWNCSMKASWAELGPYNDTFFDYWDQPSPAAELITERSAAAGDVVARSNVAHDICGDGWNCTYTISYQAAGYKCGELARGLNIDDAALDRQGAPFNSTDLIPNTHGRNLSYIAETKLGDYAEKQHFAIDREGGWLDPEKYNPFPKNYGVFQHEPVLWIGYSALTKPNEPPPETEKSPTYAEGYEPVIFRCELWITDYEVEFNHTFSGQDIKIVKRTPIRPLIDTQFDSSKKNTNATWGSAENTVAGPESNFIYPLDADGTASTMRIVAAYHSLAKLFRKTIHGEIQFVNPTTRSNIYRTNLMDTRFHIVSQDLQQQIERFFDNFTLSILSNPQLMVVTWAADPFNRSGRLDSSPETIASTPLYPCVKSRTINAYAYVSRDLWIAYAVAIFLAIACVSLGTSALAQNNFHVRDLKVSSIVAATRAPCLDELPWKSSKWGEVPWEIKQTTLGYGIIRDVGPNGTPAFGGGSTSSLGNGKTYYGFAPPGVLERTRAATFGPGTPKPKNSPFSFKTWEH